MIQNPSPQWCQSNNWAKCAQPFALLKVGRRQQAVVYGGLYHAKDQRVYRFVLHGRDRHVWLWFAGREAMPGTSYLCCWVNVT